MGLYGNDKKRQMARSILPSKGRKKARADKRRVQHHTRARVREELSSFRGIPAELADDVDADVTYARDPHTFPRYESIRAERRSADKINHFVRWAERITADIDPAERHHYMKQILPGGLIGDHAMSHLDRVAPANPVEWQWWERYESGRDRHRQKLNRWKNFVEDVHKAFFDCCHNQRQLDRFNAAMLRQHRQDIPYVFRDSRNEFGIVYKELVRIPDKDRPRVRGYHDAAAFWERNCYMRASRYRFRYIGSDSWHFKFICSYFGFEWKEES